MCGILGIVRFDRDDTSGDDRRALTQALEGLRQRGPDDLRVWAGGGSVLGATRLAMVDAAGGTQPMTSDDGRQVCAFNGEIYNPAAVRARFCAGRRFRGSSDTEVVLALLHDRGVEELAHVDGQYAIAYLDVARKTLSLARDRFGIHPLYYVETSGGVVFGSSAPVVARLVGTVRADTLAIYFSLVAGGVPEPLSSHSGVRQVRAGHALHIWPGGRRETPIDPIRFPPAGEETPHIDYAELAAALDEGVRNRGQADVRLGLLLSGGVDSAAVASSAARVGLNLPAYTLSAAAGSSVAGEADAASLTAKRCGHQPHPIPVNGDQLAMRLVDIATDLGDPLWRVGPLGFDLLAEQVRADAVKGLLTGDGSDELFCGYDVFKHTVIRRALGRRPDCPRRRALPGRVASSASLGAGALGALAPFQYDSSDLTYSHQPRWRIRAAQSHAVLSAELRRSIPADAYRRYVLDSHGAELTALSPLNRARFLELHTRFIPFLVSMQSDRPLLRNGVEGRHPFLSRTLADLAVRSDPRLMVTALHDKIPVRQGLVRPDLPATAITPKAPFEPGWEAVRDSPVFLDLCASYLSATKVGGGGLFDPDRVQTLRRRALSARPARPAMFELLLQVLTTQVAHGG